LPAGFSLHLLPAKINIWGVNKLKILLVKSITESFRFLSYPQGDVKDFCIDFNPLLTPAFFLDKILGETEYFKTLPQGRARKGFSRPGQYRTPITDPAEKRVMPKNRPD
jgi:hypothetical protein